MKVLLFGGSGMVGKELTHALLYHTVVAPSHEQIDIADAAAVERKVAEEKPDFIINAAAIIDMSAVERDQALGTRVNAEGAAAIARAASIYAVPQLLVSSSYVFNESAQAYEEDAIRNPVNAYGKTKVAAEDAVKASSDHAPWYIVRTSWIYSPSRNTFVDEVAQTLLRGKPFEVSAQEGNPTSGSDFAAAVVKHFIDSSPQSGVYHIVNEGGVSRYDIVRDIARTLGVSESLAVAKDFPSSATRPSVLLKNTKLPALPAWNASLRTYILATYGNEKSR